MNLKERMHTEIELITKKYGNVQYYEELGLILIIDYKLPRGWNRKSTDILITVPAGYPSAPLYAFKVSTGLKLESEKLPSNYREDHKALDKQWGQFSISVETWKPSDDIISGHNLLTFMLGVENRLKELN